jgi:signal transduction histidine kinase
LNRKLQTGEARSGSIENRMIAAMRIVLASSALLIIYLDPSEPDRYVPITYGALLLYTAYSAGIFLLQSRRSQLAKNIPNWSHWADVAWYLLIIALSSGTSSIFFFFFFFSVLVASFRWGFVSGLQVTLVSSISFTVIGYLTAPAGPEFELNRFLLRPIYLCVLGYLMAYWGGYEIALKRRLALLKELSLLSNPRFGVNRTVGIILERLRAFYDADTCILIINELGTGDYRLHRADRRNPDLGVQAEAASLSIISQMLAIQSEQAVIFLSDPRSFWNPRKRYYAYDLVRGERSPDGREVGEAIADLLNARSFISVPIHFRGAMLGRIYIASQRPYRFNQTDADFLLQAIDHFMPVLDNIRLVDRLASDAAEEERRKIARDIHDSIVQPYIGLELGLGSVYELLSCNADMASRPEHLTETLNTATARVSRLIEMTQLGIKDLRRYVYGLTDADTPKDSLLSSLRRFAERFSTATGIRVEVETGSGVILNDRLAAELFQMVEEGLSNIRRHTQSRCAIIRLTCSDSHLVLRIENEHTDGEQLAPFTPRSITERTLSLGGRVGVELQDRCTAVVIDVPL